MLWYGNTDILDEVFCGGLRYLFFGHGETDWSYRRAEGGLGGGHSAGGAIAPVFFLRAFIAPSFFFSPFLPSRRLALNCVYIESYRL